jgi:phosphoribosylglycinamide formyltransferase 1
MTERAERLRVGVLVSGRGSNLQSMLDAAMDVKFPASVVLVLSDRENSYAVERASAAGIEAVFVDPKDFSGRAAFDSALSARLQAARVELVCLAGYLRILGAAFVRAWAGRLMNIHPSLLPAFPGLHAQRQALEYGARISGATVHFVDEGVDTGPIILQSCVPVKDADTEESLSHRILVEEHRIYREAVRLFALGRLRVTGRHVRIEASA